MPLINRVGGGGADVSSVTATAGDVLEGTSFVDANGDPTPGKLKKQTKTAALQYGYSSTEVTPDAGCLLEKAVFQYNACSVEVSPDSSYQKIVHAYTDMPVSTIKDLVLFCTETNSGVTPGGTWDKVAIMSMYVCLAYKIGIDYPCYITGLGSDGKTHCDATLLSSVGRIEDTGLTQRTITLNSGYRFYNADYKLIYIAVPEV